VDVKLIQRLSRWSTSAGGQLACSSWILVIGGGARACAGLEALAKRNVTSVFCARQSGVASVAKCLDADVGDPRGCSASPAARHRPDSRRTELPLSRGIVDVFTTTTAIVGPA
jgi:hypothetical protein